MLVFDLDDTLYLERDFAFSGYQAVGRDLAARGAVDGARFAATCRDVFESGHRAQVFDLACDRLGIAVDPGEIDRLATLYRNHVPQIALCADAAAYLADHAGQRGGFGLITDGAEPMQRAKIAALGLGPVIATIVPTGQWGDAYAKPHPRAFIEIERHAQTRCTYVADNPAKDFVTPKARGWLTVQIIRPGRVHTAPAPDPAHEAAAVITSLAELDGILADLRRL